MNVDVCVCTYNSERFLDACLTSIEQNVPVNNLIIVDKYSTDKTLEIAKKHGAKIFQSNSSLAEARKLSFNYAVTPFVVNVDSDVILCHDWYNQVMQYWQSNAGCVWGVTIDQHPLQKAYVESMYKMRDATSYENTHLPDMVVRRDVVADIKFNDALCRGSVANEDIAIKLWIEKKGYKCVTAPVYVKHYSYPPLIDGKTYWYGASGRVGGLQSFKSIILRFVLAFPQSIYAALRSRNARVIPYWIKFRSQVLIGFLKPHKYFDYKRAC